MSSAGDMEVRGEEALAREEGVAMEDSAEMDAKVAAIIHLQQLQQKQEVMQLLEAHSVTNADNEFRMQLEELVRDHLNTCMALASCSTSHDPASISPPFSFRGDSSDAHHLLDNNRQYHSLAEKDEGESDEGERTAVQQACETSDASNARPPQNGIAGRWDERQDSEPTPRERQVREAELLALSSLHTVSTLDASFLQESPSPRIQSSIERPQRLSSLFRMWRELEGERRETARNQVNQPPDRIQRSIESDETVEAGEVENVSHSSEGMRNEITIPTESVEVDTAERREPEIQVPGNEAQASVETNEVQEADGERERVRLLVRRWMRESGVPDSGSSPNARSSSRVERLADDQRERVRRMTREWVRASNFQAGERPAERQPVLPLGQQAGHEDLSQGVSIQSQQSRIAWDADRQREMVLELLMRSEQERQRELSSILEHRIVSEFAHRSRLQSFLRGRFLRNGGSVDMERPPSSAAGEIGQLRQRRAVSGLREGFRFRLETIVRSQSGSGLNEIQGRQQEVQQSAPQVNAPELNPEEGVGQHRPMPRRAPWAHELSLEDATEYNMELRELLARQSVTTMLASEFRERLDELIRSFIHTQGRTPQPWNLSRPRHPAPAVHQGQGLQQGQVQGDRRANGSIPPPPPLPPAPLWQAIGEPQPTQPPWSLPPRAQPRSHLLFNPERMVQPAWSRSSTQRSGELEWETTSRALRGDVTVLQRSMNELREMMETSIQMQSELQRSIRQEISGALQRMYIGKEIPGEALDGSKWTTVKKGTCCICCDKQVDCLLYRCGHMCTCIKCATELHKNNGRCPMCRASIVDVVRAFTVS